MGNKSIIRTFNYDEFAVIKSQAGLNSYKISVKEWVEKTNAIGIRAKAGRYGETYAYKDIAFEFGIRKHTGLRKCLAVGMSLQSENLNAMLINDGMPQ